MGVRTLTRVAAAAALLMLAGGGGAQSVTDLPSAVRKALDSGPEVTARLNALRASVDAVDVARGALLPRIDLEGEVGRTNDRFTSRSPQNDSLNRAFASLSLSQLLWDGFSVQRDVERLGNERLARWFELNDVSEQMALEVARAWIDVQRMRRLVQLAEDSYVQHRFISDQISSRVRAGVGRGVDNEQSAARLALAESNLTTENSNLHDVSERYLRLVGERAPASMATPAQLDRGLPGSTIEALQMATRNNPSISAAIQNLRAAKSTAEAREASAWQPRVEARARLAGGNNVDGLADQKRDASVALVLNWNLYQGGADQARIRQATNLLNQAADLRDKACRDVRQTAAIAYNDVRKLAEQLPLLKRNTEAIEKARDAYRQQFDIGQRSLLDLLNAENEVYTARRALANAEFDLQAAKARAQASGGRLIATLGLRGPDATDLAPDAAQWDAGADAATRCPLEPTAAAATTTAELDAKARQMPAAKPAPAPAPAVVATATPPAPAPAPKAAAPAVLADQRVRDWAAAWSAKDIDRYLGFYGAAFKPAKGSRAAWEASRRKLVGKPGPVGVEIEQMNVRALPDGTVATRFVQRYTSTGFKDVANKQLVWQREGDQWMIVKETNR